VYDWVPTSRSELTCKNVSDLWRAMEGSSTHQRPTSHGMPSHTSTVRASRLQGTLCGGALRPDGCPTAVSCRGCAHKAAASASVTALALAAWVTWCCLLLLSPAQRRLRGWCMGHPTTTDGAQLERGRFLPLPATPSPAAAAVWLAAVLSNTCMTAAR
jgi:hypothetical protein